MVRRSERRLASLRLQIGNSLPVANDRPRTTLSCLGLNPPSPTCSRNRPIRGRGLCSIRSLAASVSTDEPFPHLHTHVRQLRRQQPHRPGREQPPSPGNHSCALQREQPSLKPPPSLKINRNLSFLMRQQPPFPPSLPTQYPFALIFPIQQKDSTTPVPPSDHPPPTTGTKKQKEGLSQGSDLGPLAPKVSMLLLHHRAIGRIPYASFHRELSTRPVGVSLTGIGLTASTLTFENMQIFFVEELLWELESYAAFCETKWMRWWSHCSDGGGL